MAKPRRIHGFLVGFNFTPGGFTSRITKPYFETDNLALATAVRKAKGTRELTPAEMEEYKAAIKVLELHKKAGQLRERAAVGEGDLAVMREEAEHDAARAATAAAAAEERAGLARARAAELAGPDKEADLFDEDPEEEEEAGTGITQGDLDGMTDAELAGVLETFGLPVPKTRAAVMELAREAVAGNIKPPEKPAEAEKPEEVEA